MRFKLATLLLVAMTIAPGFSAQMEQQAISGPKMIKLDLDGKRGVVFFGHKLHESVINPDPDYPYKAKPGGACVGCHHSRNEIGVPQLLQCKVCHLEEGNPNNPKNKEGHELFDEIAFHDNCISCHRASEKKGPTLCGGCHKMVPNL